MFDTLFTRPSTITCHVNAPYREERERYLRHCEQQGYTRSTLLLMARELRWISQKLVIHPDKGVSIVEVKAAANGWKKREYFCGQKLNSRWTRIRFIQVARSWLRFLGYWHEPEQLIPFIQLLMDFKIWMRDERGLTSATIERRCGLIKHFFLWYGNENSQLSSVTINDIDAFLGQYGASGNCRISVKNMAMALRAFFKYAESRGWCFSGFAFNIHGPRIFAQENLPSGPSWADVIRLLSSMETDQACDIRDKAMALLFGTYGFRASEVVALRFEDIDWEQNLLKVLRVKRSGKQTYPLVPEVGNAIIRYIRAARPSSALREIFLTILPPYRPMSRSAVYSVISHRMKALGIKAHHYGPHSLRHACATHLVSEGFSLKEIGDHLGHRSSSSTRIYAKVDLPGLREVATFDMGGLL